MSSILDVDLPTPGGGTGEQRDAGVGCVGTSLQTGFVPLNHAPAVLVAPPSRRQSGERPPSP